MKYCNKCGIELDIEKKFCTKCGALVNQQKRERMERIHHVSQKRIFSRLLLIGGACIISIFLLKDTISYSYYIYKGDNAAEYDRKITYYTNALSKKKEDKVKDKLLLLLKQVDDFEGKIQNIKNILTEEEVNEFYQQVYIEKAKVAFEKGFFEKAMRLLTNAQIHGYNIQTVSYISELQANLTGSEDESSASTATTIPQEEQAYIVENSSRVYLKESDLAKYSQKELALIRNEIFARHGYVFTKEEYQRYFASKPWYRPNATFKGNDSELNEVERSNINLIKKLEGNQE
ncbi:MAG: YARHG domain-containing protein [Bacillaceae bacterium]